MGLNADTGEQQYLEQDTSELLSQISVPTPERLFQIAELMRRDVTIEEINDACHIDPWFLDQMQAIVEERLHLEKADCSSLSRRGWRRAKQLGFSDAQLAYLMQVDESDIRSA